MTLNKTAQYSFLGTTNHRKPDSLGAAFIDWLREHPRSKADAIKAAGHELKHLRWDLKNNPELFEIIDSLSGLPLAAALAADPVENDAPEANEAPAETVAEESTAEDEPLNIEAELAEIAGIAEDIKAELEGLRDEEQEYFDNMPESFQNGEKGENAQTEIDAMEEAIDQLEEVVGLAL